MNIMWLSTCYHTVLSCSKIKPEFAHCCIRSCSFLLLASSAVCCNSKYHIPSFGIFCCLLRFVSHTWQFVLYISFRLQKLNRKIAYRCIRSCSLVLLASSAVYALIPITYQAVRGMHIISSSKIKSENRVLLYTWMIARAFGIFSCFCLTSYHIPASSWYTYHFVFKN